MLRAKDSLSENYSSQSTVCCIGVKTNKIDDSIYTREKADPSNFLTLDEYLTMAVKIILISADRCQAGLRNRICNDEEAISFIAYRLMLADWSYDKESNLTRYQWRRQNGIFAIRHYAKYRAVRTMKVKSLDAPLSKDGESNYYDELVSVDNKESFDVMVINAELDPIDAKMLRLHMVDNLKKCEIAEEFGISGERVRQRIANAIEKIAWVYNVSNWV